MELCMKDVTDILVGRLWRRRDHGTVKYGKTLLPWDGRNTAEDALEEALDLAVYLQKLVIERKETALFLHKAALWLHDAGEFEKSDQAYKLMNKLERDIPRIGVDS